MAREGKHSKSKKKTMRGPYADSKRTARRKTRNFRDLTSSSRKHRRALARQIFHRTFLGKLHDPGTKLSTSGKSLDVTAGGSIKYH